MKLSIVTTMYQSANFIEEFVRRIGLEAKKNHSRLRDRYGR
jgi:Asp/Glu/hydantoin racemase